MPNIEKALVTSIFVFECIQRDSEIWNIIYFKCCVCLYVVAITPVEVIKNQQDTWRN